MSLEYSNEALDTTDMMTLLKRLKRITFLMAGIALSGPTVANADDGGFVLKLSAGGTWQASNDVQIPNDEQGTRFSLEELTGQGPYPAVRLEGMWHFNDRHSLRVLLAPLSYSETGQFADNVTFNGATFSASQPVEGEYRFNSWRLGYRYHIVANSNWDLWLGGTAKVRDAEIKLTQGGVSSSDDDLGFVPLLYLAGEYRFSERWKLVADLDGLAGGPGRAIDLGIGLELGMTDKWRLGAEYRLLEGGADTDEIYNFALFNSLLLTTTLDFR